MGEDVDKRYISTYERCCLRWGDRLLGIELVCANVGVWAKGLVVAVAVFVCAGCERVSEAPGNSRSEPPVRPTFSEQLVCEVSTQALRWQHMYRLDMVQNQAEFVGGFGRRIASLRSQSMRVTPDVVAATFPASKQATNPRFEVTIERDDLSYWIEVARSDDAIPARLQGRCSILDGRGVLLVKPTGA